MSAHPHPSGAQGIFSAECSGKYLALAPKRHLSAPNISYYQELGGFEGMPGNSGIRPPCSGIAGERAAEFAGPVTAARRGWLRAELQQKSEDRFGDRAVHGDDDRMLVRPGSSSVSNWLCNPPPLKTARRSNGQTVKLPA
jgi:hypothetical protein